jgi:hypothetical protein
MPLHSSLPFSKEVYEYLRASESLVAIALSRPKSFSDEELQILAYYMAEVAKVIPLPARV